MYTFYVVILLEFTSVFTCVTITFPDLSKNAESNLGFNEISSDYILMKTNVDIGFIGQICH